MAPLDMPSLDRAGLAPVSEDQPAGVNLELDPDFGALERAAQGKPEVQYGSTIEPAVPPDWKEAASLAEALLARTHDLRVMVHLAIARLHLTGIPGFASAVSMIRHEIETHWAHVHPQLDPDDDNDPMQRSNALALLRDPARVLRPLRDAPLAGTRVNRLTWRDIAVMTGTLEPEPDREKMSEATVFGIFRDSDVDRFPDPRPALDMLLVDAPAIIVAFERQAGPRTAPDYTPLLKLLQDMHRDVVRFQSAVADTAPEAGEADPSAAAGSDGPAAGPAPVGRALATIQSITALTRREDALHAMELAASYFRSQEPSSPLPLLIDRAKRLAGMEFMDILRDLAPDGLSQAQLVAGASSE